MPASADQESNRSILPPGVARGVKSLKNAAIISGKEKHSKKFVEGVKLTKYCNMVRQKEEAVRKQFLVDFPIETSLTQRYNEDISEKHKIDLLFQDESGYDEN